MRLVLLFLFFTAIATGADPFTMKIQTDAFDTVGATDFTLPLNPGCAYDFTIDWGDSTTQVVTTSGYIEHDYAVAGVYTVRISENVVGGFPAVYFTNTYNDSLKLLEISHWGDVTWSTMNGAFAGCSNLTITATDSATARTGGVSDFASAWHGCSSLTSFPLIDTSAGTDFTLAWCQCTSLTSFPLIDTSAGTDFIAAWEYCSRLTSFPLLDLSGATDLSSTWHSCSRLTSFPFIDTAAVTIFASTWTDCSSLTSFPSIDTSSATSLYDTWAGCSKLTSFPLLDTSTVSDFGFTWYGCSSLTSFPSIDTSAGQWFNSTWYDCSSLRSFPTLDQSNLAIGADCFHGDKIAVDSYSNLLIALAAHPTYSHVEFNGGFSKFNASAAVARSFLIDTWHWTILDGGLADPMTLTVKTDNVYAGSSGANQFSLPLNPAYAYDFTIDWGDGTSQIVTSSTNPFHTYATAGIYTIQISENFVGGFPGIQFTYRDDYLKPIELSHWGNLIWATMNQAFFGCSNLVITATDSPLTATVSDFSFAWAYCSSLATFPLLDTSAGTNFEGAWRGCTGLTSFPLLDTSAGTNFDVAWSLCENLTIFPLIDTSKGTRFWTAWEGCSGLTSFPLIDTSSGTTFQDAWYGCSGLTSFPLLNTSSGTNFQDAWYGCSGLTSFPLLDTSSGTNFRSAWLGCSSLTGFPLIKTAAGTDFRSAWESCNGLTSFPLIDTAAGTTFERTWFGCSSLTSFPTLNLGSMVDGTDCFTGVALSTSSYSALLIALAAQNTQSHVVFDGGTSQFNTAASPSRSTLTGTRYWTIRDDGGDDPMALIIGTDLAGGSGPNQFTLPLNPSFTCNITVDWGDGATQIVTATDSTHTYATAGTYAIRIRENHVGGFAGLYFNDTGDKLKVLELSNWGNATWVTMDRAFAGCANLTITATDSATAQTGGADGCSYAWYGCSSLTTFPPINTAGSSSFQYAWYGCSSLTSFPFINTAAGVFFNHAWSGCSNLTTFPSINTSAGQFFNDAWHGCSSLTSFPLIDTSAGVYFDDAWHDCSSLTSFPLINTAVGQRFNGAWRGCSSLTGFPPIDTAAGEEFNSTWKACDNLTGFPTLDLGGMIDGTDCFKGVTLSPVSYSNLLISLAAHGTREHVLFDAGFSQYKADAVPSRGTLTGERTWTIIDGGPLAVPGITWATPGGITYGTALSATQLNATAAVGGTFAFSPAAGSVPGAGTHTLSVIFTPTDTATYDSATATVELPVDQAPLSVVADPASRAYGDASPSFTGTLTGVVNGDAITATYASSATTATAAGVYGPASPQAITPTLVDPGGKLTNYRVTRTKATLTITQVASLVSWTAPTGITYGTALSATQLSATASVAGAFVYTPAAGTVLHAGATQTLSVTFTPTDAVNYTTVTITRPISVAKAALTITAADKTMVAGAAVPTLTATGSGFVSPDTLAVLDTAPALTTTATSASAAGTYPITVSGAVDADYTITFVAGTMTVTAPATSGADSGSGGGGGCGLGSGVAVCLGSCLFLLRGVSVALSQRAGRHRQR